MKPLSRPPILRAVMAGPLPPPVNGMSNAFALAAGGLPQHGWEVDILDIADRTAPRRREAFSLARAWSVARCLFVGFSRIPRADVFYLTVSQSRLGFIKDALLLGWAHLLGVPTVAHLHGGNIPALWQHLGPLGKMAFSFVYRRAALVMVLSEAFRDQFSCIGMPQNKVSVLPNGTNLPLGKARCYPAEPFRILSLSNIHVEKGYLDLISMMTCLSQSVPQRHFELHLCGAFCIGGPFRTIEQMEIDLEQRCRALAVNVSVHRHGLVDSPTKLSLLDSSHVLVLPSLIPEGQPLAIVEAFTRGLPVAAYDWPGTRAMLGSGMASLLVPVGDPRALADAVALLSSDTAAYQGASSHSIALASEYRSETHLTRLASNLRSAACGFAE